jgi:hypothetical protein
MRERQAWVHEHRVLAIPPAAAIEPRAKPLDQPVRVACRGKDSSQRWVGFVAATYAASRNRVKARATGTSSIFMRLLAFALPSGWPRLTLRIGTNLAEHNEHAAWASRECLAFTNTTRSRGPQAADTYWVQTSQAGLARR